MLVDIQINYNEFKVYEIKIRNERFLIKAKNKIDAINNVKSRSKYGKLTEICGYFAYEVDGDLLYYRDSDFVCRICDRVKK
jgi:hypothetical protein